MPSESHNVYLKAMPLTNREVAFCELVSIMTGPDQVILVERISDVPFRLIRINGSKPIFYDIG